MKHHCRARRRGLAPLELVLWLPVLLFLVALIINYGSMATWRVRGEIVARDAAFRARFGRSGSDEGHLLGEWPTSAVMMTTVDPPITQIDDPFLQHPVARGPLPNGFVVRPVLDPDRIGAYRGVAEIERRFPLMPRLGGYQSGAISGSLLDRKWTNWEMGIANVQRRIPVLYQLPRTDPGLPQAFRQAISAVVNIPHFAALIVLERDADMRLITGRDRDFHPQVFRLCELDREVVYRQQVERLVDVRDSLRQIRLGEISRLPRTMTDYFLSNYRRYVQRLEARIQALEAELAGPPPASSQRAAQIRQEIATLQAEIDRIEPKIEQLEQYESRLDGIENGLRQSADAVLA